MQTRKYGDSDESKAEAIHYASIDSAVALMFALFINGAILVMAAAVFHGTVHEGVAEIGDAYQLLSPLLGSAVASALFAVALLCSGQNATLTGTLAGQIVMEGFLDIRLRPWLRRLITRLLAIVPAIVVILFYGDRGTGPLIILSQVILSLQLPFAIFPLVQFTSDPKFMGKFCHCGAATESALASPIADLNNNPSYGLAGRHHGRVVPQPLRRQGEILGASGYPRLDRPSPAGPPLGAGSEYRPCALHAARSALRKAQSSPQEGGVADGGAQTVRRASRCGAMWWWSRSPATIPT